MRELVALQYRRNDDNFTRGSFRVRGDTIDLFPAHYEDRAWRSRTVRRRGGFHHRIRSADRQKGGRPRIGEGLCQFALCDAAADACAGDEGHQLGIGRAARMVSPERQAAGSAAAGAAHLVRSRDDRGDGLLRRHRELFALADGPQTRRAAADPVRISARRCAGLRRRKPCHRAADRRHVPRRLSPQGDLGGIWLPPALLHRQPPAQIRGMGRDAAADGLCLGHARPLGDGAHGRRLRRTGDPPHRPHRSAGGNPPRRTPGRRPDRRMPRSRQDAAIAPSSPRSPRRWRKT